MAGLGQSWPAVDEKQLEDNNDKQSLTLKSVFGTDLVNLFGESLQEVDKEALAPEKADELATVLRRAVSNHHPEEANCQKLQ